MKKLILLLIAIISTVAVSAQLAVASIPQGQSYAKISATYTVTNTAAKYFQYNSTQLYPTTQDYIARIDSVSGNATSVTVLLQGRKFDNSAWTTIGTVVWTRVPALSADTTFVISNATANRYRSFKVLYTVAGTGGVTVKNQEFKQYYE